MSEQISPRKKMKSEVEKLSVVEMENQSVTESVMDSDAMNRFSRQNAALGAETTAKLIKMKVLIVGMRGVGVEAAKNLSLQGAGAITIFDDKPAEISDVGLNFFISEADVRAGLTRAAIIAPKLKELNSLCVITVAEALSEEIALSHSALVITDRSFPMKDLLYWNNFCRRRGIPFFYSFLAGVSCSLFSDLGPAHVINDPTGSRPMQKIISNISAVDETTCLIHYETPEGQPSISLSEGTYEVSDVKGLPRINGKVFEVTHPPSDPVKTVRVKFSLDSADVYVSGGQLLEKKIPKEYPMESLEVKLRSPGSPFADPPTTVLTDLINFGGETQQHVAFYACLEFVSRQGRFPGLYNDEDAAMVRELADELLESRAIDLECFEIDSEFFKTYSYLSSVEIQPMVAFVGGVLAQEVVKCTGKFTPIPGFMHFSAREVLPSETPVDVMPRGSMYDNLAAVFGWDFIEKLKGLQYFMVGCGALGCEFMKNFALNGVCCGPQGKLVVTDADRIELSNLSRQFLFREHNVGQPKSRAAAAMAKVMNPAFNVEALELFVGANTEDSFNDDFWMNLSGVCNALDNMVMVFTFFFVG